MKYRMLGKTGLSVSEIGLGAEWLERHTAQEVKAIIDHCEATGINILDCWMSEPKCALEYRRSYFRKTRTLGDSGTYWLHLAEWTVCADPPDG